MRHLLVIIPSNESLSTLQEYLPDICNASSDLVHVSVLLVDSRLQSDVQSFCEGLGVQYIYAEKACRAIQLNHGANLSDAEHLFFLHLDSILPVHYDLLIKKAFENGADSGCFRLKFSPSTLFLNFWSYFTRFHWRVARGGDQGLFVSRKSFLQVGGYKEWELMEDVHICHQLENQGNFKIIETPIITSSRKYVRYGQVYLQTLFSSLMLLFWMGVKPVYLMKIYNRFLSKD